MSAIPTRFCGTYRAFALLAAFLWIVGCDNTSSAPTKAGSPQAEQRAAAQNAGISQPGSAKAKSGTFTGRITTVDGKPIVLKGAKLTVDIVGISTNSGQKVRYNPKVNAEGFFEAKLTEGTYRAPTAAIEMVYNGQKCELPLAREPDDSDDRESEEGIVQNFVWKLKGPRCEPADPSNHTHWYGGTICMQMRRNREDLDKRMPPAPAGTKVVFTLTPTGPLIDGSEGQTLTFERKYTPDGDSLDNYDLYDIPVGTYTLKGHEILPDNTKRPLVMRQAVGAYAESIDIKFVPDRIGTIGVVYVGFARSDK